MEKKRKKRNTAVLVIAAAVAACAAIYLAAQFRDYSGAQTEYRLLRAEATEETEEGFSVDFDYLKSVNPDVVAWIRIPGLDMSYPVVQGTDNSYYLSHTFEKQSFANGSVFMDCSNSPDFSDMDTVIYGHNLRSGKMFGVLHKYESKETWEENPYFIIYTPDGTYRYDIFSVWNMTGSTMKIYRDPSEEYGEYITWHKRNSMYDTGVGVNATDRTVILYTCTSVDRGYRFVVCGKLAGEYRD